VLNKKYQLADWRVRPLPAEMIEYAKSDTHYLLSVFDVLRQELWAYQKEVAIRAVFDISKKTCLIRYEKPLFWSVGYRKLLTDRSADTLKHIIPKNSDGMVISDTQDIVLATLYNWRDEQARERDESVEFIMSNSELVRIGLTCPVNQMELEKCRPLCGYVLEHAEQIVNLVQSQLQLGPTEQAGGHISIQTSSSGDDHSKRLYGRALATPVKGLMDTSLSSINGIDLYPQTHTELMFVPSDSRANKYGTTTGHHSSRVNLSPALDANTIFRAAGWVTPVPVEFGEHDSRPSTPYIFDNIWRKRVSCCGEVYRFSY
jgi:hypothetical protein